MEQVLLQLLVLVISNPQLHDAASTPVANGLAKLLPDVTEDAIASFMRTVADKLEAANP